MAAILSVALAVLAVLVAVPVVADQPGVTRVSGLGRAETAVALSQVAFPHRSAAVVLARSDDYADALAAGPLAASMEGPILLTGPDQLDPAVADEVLRLRPETAVLVGGETALSENLEQELRAAGIPAVERIGGPTRYDTAALVAMRIGGEGLYIAEGSNADPARGWPDALAASPVAALQGWPVLLVARDTLPAATASALQELRPLEAVIVGGEAAVSQAVAAELAAHVPTTQRIGGVSRWETSALLADRAIESGASADSTWVASGGHWAEALIAGPAVAAAGGVLLLVDGVDLQGSPATAEWARAHPGQRVTIVGDGASVSSHVESQLAQSLGSAEPTGGEAGPSGPTAWSASQAYAGGEVITADGTSWESTAPNVGWGPGAGAAVGEPQGFGAGVSGGAGGSELWVTSLADRGPGTLREALRPDGPAARWVRFAVSGELRLERRLPVPSNTTIDGRGAGVVLTRHGLFISRAQNVIVVNLQFAGRDAVDDAVHISDGSRDVWIDHCDFSSWQDGLIDITRRSTNVTVSWNRFWSHDKVMLVNGEGTVPGDVQVTVHHNWFFGTNQRNPRAVGARVHAFNNVVTGWRDYGMQAGSQSELLSEANIFLADSDNRAVRASGGRVRASGDVYLNGALGQEFQEQAVFMPQGRQAVTADSPGPALQHLVEALSGWQDIPSSGVWQPAA